MIRLLRISYLVPLMFLFRNTKKLLRDISGRAASMLLFQRQVAGK